MDIEILELCKENIQPLRRGRKASQLGLALQAEGNVQLQTQLLREREEYELNIITYDGPDPLVPRMEYIAWLEQTYIKHGRECNLIPLLEDTITLFKDNPRYKQDHRFIDIVVKYVEAQENAVELFQMVYSQGLGTMCASLYRSWAEVLDQASDFKRADQVYQLGIANHAEPVDMLKQAHAQFQLSIGRRMMLSGGEFNHPAHDDHLERQALGKLKKGVGSIRNAHGSAGVLSVKSINSAPSKKQISVFQDDGNNYEHLISVALQKNKIGSIATSSKNNEENTLKPGTWNKGYNRKEVSMMLSVPPSTPSFKVHVDPDVVETPKVASKTPSNVLKTRKAELLASKNAVEVFSSSTPSTHKALQAILEVYAGGREFSFEELRFAYYKKQEEIKNSKKQFETPAKYLIKAPSTPFVNTSSHNDCETPMASMRSLSISDDQIKTITSTGGSEIHDSNIYSPIEGSSEGCFKTPLKHPAGFVPITPSLKGIDLSEFIETPVQNTQLKPKESGKVPFNIFVDEDYSSNNVARSNLLPIIEENQETENETSPKLVKKSHVRKKQLFSEK